MRDIAAGGRVELRHIRRGTGAKSCVERESAALITEKHNYTALGGMPARAAHVTAQQEPRWSKTSVIGLPIAASETASRRSVEEARRAGVVLARGD